MRSQRRWSDGVWCEPVTTLSLVSLGTFVVKHGKRRLVDPHGFRGLSSLKIGWNWVAYALRRGDELLTTAS